MVRQISNEYGWVAARLVIFNLLAFLIIPLLTKTMGASAYGYWSQFQAFLQFGVPFFTLNLQQALIRFLPATEPSQRNEVLSSVGAAVLLCGILTGALIVVVREQIAVWFFGGRTDIVILLAAVFTAAALNKLLYYYLRAERRIRLHSLVMVGERLFLLLLAGSMVWAGLDIFWVVASSPLSLVAFFGLLLVLVFRTRKLARPNWSRVRKYAKFSVPLLLGGVGATLVEISDRYLIAYFKGMDAVGLYTTAYGLGRGFKLVVMPFIFVVPQVISEYWDEGAVEKVEHLLSRSFRYFIIIFGLIAAIAGPVGEELLALVSTRAIAAKGYVVLLLVAASYLFYAIWFFYSRWLYLTERSVIIGTMWIVGGTLNVVLNVMLIPLLGVVGAAVATLASQMLVGCWAFVGYHRRLPIDLDKRSIWGTLVACGGTATLVWWCRAVFDDMMIYLAVAATAGCLLYVGLALTTGALRKEEMTRITRYLKREAGSSEI